MTPERALQRKDRAQLLAVLETLHREREAGYPISIAEGKLSKEDAARGLAYAAAMVAEWCWACDPSEPALPDYGRDGHFGIFNTLLAAEAANIAVRARRRADAAPRDAQAAQRADQCEAIAYLQQDQPGVPGISRLSWHECIDRRIARRFAEAKAA